MPEPAPAGRRPRRLIEPGPPWPPPDRARTALAASRVVPVWPAPSPVARAVARIRSFRRSPQGRRGLYATAAVRPDGPRCPPGRPGPASAESRGSGTFPGLAWLSPGRTVAASPLPGRGAAPHKLEGMADRKSFGSDNHAGAHEAVLRAVIEANAGDAVAYGDDGWTRRATAELRRAFRADGDVFLVFNGSAANILGLSLLLRRHEGVICAESAHINTDECGAAERILGTKLLTIPAPDGKLTPEMIRGQLSARGDDHRAQPGAVVITQTTELGTCYTLEELRKIAEFCRASDLGLYIDGARLANAAAFLNCSLADLAECADVLSFGGTKNGGMGAEAVIVMRRELAADGPYLRKQQLQLASKMRYLAAQFLALSQDELWRRNASHANTMAQRLADGVRDVPGVDIRYPVQSDAVFAWVDPRFLTDLQREWFFYVWDERASVVRCMTAFDTTEADVDRFVASIRSAAGQLSGK